MTTEERLAARPGGAALTFEHKGQRVGYFQGLDAYPTQPGKYRYMPYRGLGHFNMIEECARAGRAQCTFTAPNGTIGFVAKPAGEYGMIDVSEIVHANP